MEIYHGCGNNFIITEDSSLRDKKDLVISLCQKYKTDGLIIFLSDPYEMVLINADGSFASMCGNGIRAYAKYGFDHQLITSNELMIKTLAGLIPLQIVSSNPFFAKVNLGIPSYSAKKMKIKTAKAEYFGEEELLGEVKIKLYAIWTGTDHLVVIVDNFKDINKMAAILSKKSEFQAGINVNFMQIINTHEIAVRTYERGVGWTKACGTGSSACVAVGSRLGLLDTLVEVSLLGGSLEIEIINNDIYMYGPAAKSL